MSFSQSTEERDGRLLDTLTDDESGLRIMVARLGAELVSLARRDANGNWIGFLWRDGELSKPASGWPSHATVMGYFLHRLKDGRSTYRGQLIEGGNHSFLRNKEWHPAAPEPGRLTYRITPEDFTATEYPLKVSLDLTYALEGEQLRTTFHFRNHEKDKTAHVGFGTHPGFASSSFGSFRFEMPAGLYRRHLAPNNFLSGETQDIRHEGGDMPFDKSKLVGSYILEFVDVPERTFAFTDLPSGRSVSLDFNDVPYMTLWSDGGPFFCAEPCWGLTDHDQQRAFEDKEGIQKIPANGELRKGFGLRARLKD